MRPLMSDLRLCVFLVPCLYYHARCVLLRTRSVQIIIAYSSHNAQVDASIIKNNNSLFLCKEAESISLALAAVFLPVRVDM